jgi:hypothetical protein
VSFNDIIDYHNKFFKGSKGVFDSKFSVKHKVLDIIRDNILDFQITDLYEMIQKEKEDKQKKELMSILGERLKNIIKKNYSVRKNIALKQSNNTRMK